MDLIETKKKKLDQTGLDSYSEKKCRTRLHPKKNWIASGVQITFDWILI